MNSHKKILELPLHFAISIFIISSLMRIMHWPYSTEIQWVALIVIAILYPVRFLKKEQKLFIDYFKLALVLIWIASNITSYFKFAGAGIIVIVNIINVFIWFFLEGIGRIKQLLKDMSTLSSILFGISIAATIIGALFKIMHWPFSTYLLIIGLGLQAAWVGTLPILRKENFSTFNEENKILDSVLIEEKKTPHNTTPVKENNFKKLLFYFSATGIVIGAIFKIMHWPLASILLLSGLGLGVLWIILEILSNKKN